MLIAARNVPVRSIVGVHELCFEASPLFACERDLPAEVHLVLVFEAIPHVAHRYRHDKFSVCREASHEVDVSLGTTAAAEEADANTFIAAGDVGVARRRQRQRGSRSKELAAHGSGNDNQAHAQQSQGAGLGNNQVRIAEVDATVVIDRPLILIRVNSLRRSSGHHSSGPDLPTDLARKLKHIVPLGVADHRPCNRPDESTAKNDPFRLAEIADASHDKAGVRLPEAPHVA